MRGNDCFNRRTIKKTKLTYEDSHFRNRGIPNNYGGFQQFAEYLSVGLVEKGHEVTVYNPHFHRCPEEMFHGVAVRYIYNPELWMGASAHFIYDFLCLKDALKEGFDVILECGYHSNAPSYYLMRGKNKAVVGNQYGWSGVDAQ